MSNIGTQGEQSTSTEIAALVNLTALAASASNFVQKTGVTTFASAAAGGGTSPLTTKGDIFGFSTVSARIPVGTDGQVLTADAASTPGVKWATIAGTGTVTTISVVSTNGFTGTVANATTTPAITLTTSITGIIKGNGTALTAATAGSDYTIPAMTAVQTFSAADTTNFVPVTVTQNDVTNNPNAMAIVNAGTGHGLIITQNGSTAASISTGGALNITNTGNAGPGLVVYTNHAGSATGRLAVFNQANTLFDQDVVLIQNVAGNTTALNVKNAATGKGGIKIEQTSTGSDANAACLSIDVGFGGGGTAAQAIFVDATNGGTTGNLLNIKNAGTTKFVINSAGHMTVEGVTSTGATGSNLLVFATSPTLITPVLGVATATSINGLTITTTTGTLTMTNSKTLAVTNTITLSGTDSTIMTFPSTTATIARTDAAQTFSGAQTYSNAVIYTNNAVTASGNAATVPVTARLTTVTNNSAATLTITITTASAVDGQLLMVRVLDFSGVAQTIAWVNTENSTATAPTTSNGSTTAPLTVGFQYNSGNSKWRCIASA